MEKVKKVITNIICIVIILICVGIIWVGIQIKSQHNGSLSSWIQQWKTNPIVREEPLGLVRIPNEIIAGIHFGEREENYCLVYKVAESALLDGDWVDGEYMNMTTESLSFNAKYIVGHYRMVYYSWGLEMSYEEMFKSFILYVTPTNGEEIKTKEIDMLKVFEGLPYRPINKGQVVERNGKNYVEIGVESRIGDDEVRRVLFDLEEGTVIEDKSMLFEYSVKGRYISIVSENSLASIDIHTGNSLVTYSQVEELLQSRLAKEHPEIKGLIESIERNEGERILVECYFEKIDDPDEIMKLFEKEGVDPYENTELGKKVTKDGKRHKINSFEDFLKWYDFSESQKEEVEMLLGKDDE